MFKVNKYTKVYYQITSRAQLEQRLKGNGIYYEKHHIIPRSLGGVNSKGNIALLSPKEHYVCHLLLTKMVDGLDKQEMSYALWNISNNGGNKNQHRHKLTARAYNTVRQIYAQNTRKEWSQEYKDRMKDVWKKSLVKHYGEDNTEFKGYYHTPWGRFVTRKEAVLTTPYKGLSTVRIRYACKNNENVVLRRKPISIPQDWVGKTYKEIGFWFEPK